MILLCFFEANPRDCWDKILPTAVHAVVEDGNFDGKALVHGEFITILLVKTLVKLPMVMLGDDVARVVVIDLSNKETPPR